MILVLGIGNDILKDDGIGIKLVNDLRESGLFPGLHFETTLLGGLETLEILSRYDRVVILDAIRTKDGIPGEVYRFSLDDFRETLHLSNLHDINFLTALELAKKLNIPIPGSIEIIAVEIVEDTEFGNEFTPLLQEKYPEILAGVKEYLSRL
jgi:hydrogenase maturation protease